MSEPTASSGFPWNIRPLPAASRRCPRAALLLLALTLPALTSCVQSWVEADDPRLPQPGPAPAGLPAAGLANLPPAPPPPAPATQPAPPATQPATPPPLRLSLRGAILRALEHNRQILVDRYNVPIQRTFVTQQQALFDPLFSGSVAAGRQRDDRPTGAGRVLSESDAIQAGLGLSQFFPTGATIDLTAESNIGRSAFSDELSDTRLGLTATQALLRGAGVTVNLVGVRQAHLDVLRSQYELRGFAEAVLADVEITYWDYALARRQIEIFEQSLRLAQQQLSEAQEFVRVGKLAAIELAASQAEVALRREDLINAHSSLETTRLQLIRLVNPEGPTGGWHQQIILENQPFVPTGKLDSADAHAAVALALRPELNQARLLLERDELEIVRTRNGLLPQLDLFVTLGKTGYARSFGNTFGDLDGESYDALVGLRFEQPVGNRDAQARYLRSRLTRKQQDAAVDNLVQLVQVDVRTAYVEVLRTREQIAATNATRNLQQETLRAETEKFRVGKSTSLLVAQAQRDLLESQIAEVQAVVGQLQALVELFRLEGSLLERRGIAAAGLTVLPGPNLLPPAKP